MLGEGRISAVLRRGIVKTEKTETELPPANMQNTSIKQLYHESLFTPASNTDFGFSVGVLAATPNPQNAIYKGLHQCYSADPVKANFKPSEMDSGNIAIKRLLEGDRGHYSPFEHATITLVLGGINHGTIQQLIRSRIGVSFSIQSFRYTSEQILKAADGITDIEKIAYLRPIGKYHDREISYDYTQKTRAEDLSVVSFLVKHVAKRIREGMPAEQARGMLGFDYRQHGVVSFNTRSFMGFFDRRSKKDAQIEIRVLSELMLKKFHQWQPVIADYYVKNRWGKAKLAP